VKLKKKLRVTVMEEDVEGVRSQWHHSEVTLTQIRAGTAVVNQRPPGASPTKQRPRDFDDPDDAQFRKVTRVTSFFKPQLSGKAELVDSGSSSSSLYASVYESLEDVRSRFSQR
jgi:hypothetical protein